jgi:hypothetical protein
MLQKNTLLSKNFIANAAFKILAVFVDGSYVPPEMIFKTKMSRANATLKIIDFFREQFLCANFSPQM